MNKQSVLYVTELGRVKNLPRANARLGFFAGGNTAVSNTAECRRRRDGRRAVLRRPSSRIVRARWPNIDRRRRRRRPRYYSYHRQSQYTLFNRPCKSRPTSRFLRDRVCPRPLRFLRDDPHSPAEVAPSLPNRFFFSFSPVPTGAVPSAPLHHDPGGRPSQLAHARPARPVVTPPQPWSNTTRTPTASGTSGSTPRLRTTGRYGRRSSWASTTRARTSFSAGPPRVGVKQ